ncbi:MAG: hypothetical protein V1789_08210 [PVC group bacterium]
MNILLRSILTLLIVYNFLWTRTLFAEPCLKNIVLTEPEFGDVSAILGIKSITADFELSEPVQGITIKIDLYKNGVKSTGTQFSFGITFIEPRSSGKANIQFADLDLLPLGDLKKNSWRVCFQIQLGGQTTLYTFEIPKKELDFSRGYAFNYFSSTAAKGNNVPLLWILGTTEGKGMSHTNTSIEKLLKLNPRSAILIISIDVDK